MAGAKTRARSVPFRLIHDGAQPGPPLDEPFRFGLQDAKGAVYPGTPRGDGTMSFDFTLDVKGEPGAGSPVFSGACAHGPPAARFIYLSWRRVEPSAAPFGWRIKMPLSAVGWEMIAAAADSRCCIEADVRGRRPHATAPVVWRLGEMPP